MLPPLIRLRWVGVAAAIAAGVAFRVWIYRTALGAPDADEAIVGLGARHALHGGFTGLFAVRRGVRSGAHPSAA